MARQELNQMRWDIRKHNYRAFTSIGIVLALYCLVGFLEHMA